MNRFIVFLVLLVLFPLLSLNANLFNNEPVEIKYFSKNKISYAYILHDPISINNDLDFSNQASNENWPGNGSQNNPYIIKNYIIDTEYQGISIYSIDLYFIIENCMVIGGYNLIYISYSKNGLIVGNNVSNAERSGIVIEGSQDIFLINNTSIDNKNTGIEIVNSQNITIIGNSAGRNGFRGMDLTNSVGLYVANNYVFKNKDNGASTGNLRDSFLEGNIAYKNEWSLFVVHLSTNNTFQNNIAIQNGEGIKLIRSNNNTIRENIAFNSFKYIDIGMVESSTNNTVFNNKVMFSVYLL